MTLQTVQKADILITQPIGSGYFSTVSKASLVSKSGDKPFALKVLKPETGIHFPSRRWITKRLQEEIQIMNELGCQRDTFVKILFFYQEDERIVGYAMEYLKLGTLHAVNQNQLIMDNDQKTFSFLTADWMLQISEAFEFLQNRKPGPVLHRDISVHNVLVTDSLDIKIADFGLAKVLPDSCVTQETLDVEEHKGVERRLPETYGNISRKPDVYGDRYLYGVLVVEAFSGTSLRSTLGKYPEDFKTLVASGKHIDEFEKLIDECFPNDNEDKQLEQLRSTAKQVVRMTAHQMPEKRATFAEVSGFWSLCDQGRMRNEKQLELLALKAEALLNKKETLNVRGTDEQQVFEKTRKLVIQIIRSFGNGVQTASTSVLHAFNLFKKWALQLDKETCVTLLMIVGTIVVIIVIGMVFPKIVSVLTALCYSHVTIPMTIILKLKDLVQPLINKSELGETVWSSIISPVMNDMTKLQSYAFPSNP